MALDKRIEKAREAKTCGNLECPIPKGQPYYLVASSGKGPAVSYCCSCYDALPPYFKRTTNWKVF